MKKVCVLLTLLMLLTVVGCSAESAPIIPAAPTISADRTEVEIVTGQSQAVKIFSAGSISVSKSNEKIAINVLGKYILINAMSPGDSSITVTDNISGNNLTINVQVKEFELIMNDTPVTINLNESETYQLVFSNIEDNNKDLVFSTSDYNVAIVSYDGLVRAKKAGEVEIKATHPATGVTYTKKISVTGAIETNPFTSMIEGYHYLDAHIQGAVIDDTNRYMYLIYTTLLVKLDVNTRQVVSTLWFPEGTHTGGIAFNPEDGKVYGPMAIDVYYTGTDPNVYIAIVDVDRMTEMDMTYKDDIFTTVYLGHVFEQFYNVKGYGPNSDEIRLGGKYGAVNSIGALAFGPAYGVDDGRYYLTAPLAANRGGTTIGGKNVLDRIDNDYSGFVQLDVSDYKKYEKEFDPQNPHISGPTTYKSFELAYVGFHTYGPQVMMYDKALNAYIVAYYTGESKNDPSFPNKATYLLDASVAPREEDLVGCNERGKVLTFKEYGEKYIVNGKVVWGLEDYMGEGVVALNDGRYYIINSKNNGEGGQGSDIRMFTFDTNQMGISKKGKLFKEIY